MGPGKTHCAQQQHSTVNPGGLQAFISSRLPALKVERGWPVKASRCPAVGGHARPTEEPNAERWRTPGLHLFKASGLQGRTQPGEEPHAECSRPSSLQGVRPSSSLQGFRPSRASVGGRSTEDTNSAPVLI